MHFIKHIAGEAHSGVQRCIICGAILQDYIEGVMLSSGSHPAFWDTDKAVYISQTKNPRISCTQIGEGDTSENCKITKRKLLTMKTVIYIFIIAIILNGFITKVIDRLKHPNLTETQLFLLTPKEFIWDFKI